MLRRPLQGETVTLSPAIKSYHPAAIALPGEIDRATSFHNLKPEHVRAHFSEGETLHHATTAMAIDHPLVADGCVYSHGSLSAITQQRRRPILTGTVEEIGEAQLCTTHCGSIFFGDWLMIDTLLDVLADERSLTRLSIATKAYAHEPDYRHYFGIPQGKVGSIVRPERLWIVEDNGMTASRIARYQVLRDRIGVPHKTNGRRIFIDRGETGASRGIANRSEVITALSSRGFETIYPERMAVAEIKDAISAASICISVEGSALSHATLLMPAGGCVFALQPANRVHDCMKWYTDALDQRYAYLICDNPTPDTLTVNISRLHQTLDLIEEA